MTKSKAGIDLQALPPVLTVEEAAAILGMSKTKAYEAIRQHEWPTPVFRVGRLLKIPTPPLLAFLGADTAPAPQEEVKVERPTTVRQARVSDMVVLEQAVAVLAALGREWLAMAVRDAIAGLGPTAPVERRKDEGELRRTPWPRQSSR